MNRSTAEIVREYGPFPGIEGVHGVTYDGRHVWFASGDQLNALDPVSGKMLRSLDVVHDFYVPEFRAKMDMIPGSVTYYWFTPTRTGTFEVLCAELCSTGHPYMRGSVVVEAKADYEAWLQQQKTFAELNTPAKASALKQEGTAR